MTNKTHQDTPRHTKTHQDTPRSIDSGKQPRKASHGAAFAARGAVTAASPHVGVLQLGPRGSGGAARQNPGPAHGGSAGVGPPKGRTETGRTRMVRPMCVKGFCSLLCAPLVLGTVQIGLLFAWGVLLGTSKSGPFQLKLKQEMDQLLKGKSSDPCLVSPATFCTKVGRLRNLILTNVCFRCGDGPSVPTVR